MSTVEGTTLAREIYDGIKLEFRHLVMKDFKELGNRKLKMPDIEMRSKQVERTDYTELLDEDRKRVFNILINIYNGNYHISPLDRNFKALLESHRPHVLDIRTWPKDYSSDVLLKIRMNGKDYYVNASEYNGKVHLYGGAGKYAWDNAIEFKFTEEQVENLFK